MSASSSIGSTAAAQSVSGAMPKGCQSGGLLVKSSAKFTGHQVPKGISVNASGSTLCREKLLDALENLRKVNELWTALRGSQRRNAHVGRLLSGYASATILRSQHLSALCKQLQAWTWRCQG